MTGRIVIALAALAAPGCANPMMADGGVPDLAVPVDAAPSAADLAAADRALPPSDLALPSDLAAAPSDLAAAPSDLAAAPVDLAAAPVDLAAGPADFAQAGDLAVLPNLKVGWMGVGHATFTKCNDPPYCKEVGWFWKPGIPNPITIKISDYQAYGSAPSLGIEVYVPGVTDVLRDGSGAGQIIAEVYSPFFSATPMGAWAGYRMPFRAVTGNNYQFWWELVNFRGSGKVNGASMTPIAGTYEFKFRVSVDGGKGWYWMGTDAWPNEGMNRQLIWQLQ